MDMLLRSRTYQPMQCLLGAVIAFGLCHGARAQGDADAHQHGAQLEDVISSGKQFVETLRPDLRQKAAFEFETDERFNWHFIPRERQGVMLKEMNLQERRAAHDLLRSVLSSQGYLKATAVMSLEAILRELEGPGAEERRDPEKYWFSVFGSPGSEQPWGFRVEGHHLSLNFSSVDGLIISAAPMFYGANPAEVRSGPRAGLRVLGDEEELARDLVKSLSDEQRGQAVIAEEAYDDIIMAPGEEHAMDWDDPKGLAAREMTDAQSRKLYELITLYATNLRGELAEQELAGLNDDNFGEIRFAWAGGLDRGMGHYYRIQAPTFIIEYDNTQNNANHIHTVWHSRSNNFGLDTLRKHYEDHKHE